MSTAATGSSSGSTGGGDAGLPAIDPSRNVGDLTNAEKGVLCDWMTELYGGYGTTTVCAGMGEVVNSADQASCIATALQFRCAVTVAAFETCVLARAPSLACDMPYEPCRPLSC